MATIQKRKSHGQTYWYIVESRRVNGKPRPVTLAYLGKAEDLLERLLNRRVGNIDLKSYSHGDTTALLNVATELDITGIINRHVPLNKKENKPIRNNLTVGATFLLAAIGRACCPTSKQGWYEWCKTTSLEYVLRSSFKDIDSGHFWDQMDYLPVESIPYIEEELVRKLIDLYDIKLDTVLYDTTNFFTFIDSGNDKCSIAKRGKNKQKRNDLRQVGLSLLVTRSEQFPLFHKMHEGNKNDIATFKEVFKDFVGRIELISKELSDVTIVFDKGNNSKDNFAMLDGEKGIHYVCGLVSSHFKKLIEEANKNFSTIKINDVEVPVYRIKQEIWGAERTCVISVSKQLKEGQIRGIYQHLEKKTKQLSKLKQQLENPKKRKKCEKQDIENRLKNIIKGQFIEDILKYDLINLEDGNFSFTYYIDSTSFDYLKYNILGRRILATNRHDWSNEEIILAYRGQSKVEYAFRNLKNPCHMTVRPQYHWTDQKIQVHILICLIGYLLSVAAYTKAKNKLNYTKNISTFLDTLRQIRLSAIIEKTTGKGKPRINFKIEKMDKKLDELANALGIINSQIKVKIPSFSVYKSNL